MACDQQPEAELTAAELWQEHGGREVVTTTRYAAPKPPPGPVVRWLNEWVVPNLLSIIILLVAIGIWVGRRLW